MFINYLIHLILLLQPLWTNGKILGNGGNISPYGWTFGNNGMKLYIGTEDELLQMMEMI